MPKADLTNNSVQDGLQWGGLGPGESLLGHFYRTGKR